MRSANCAVKAAKASLKEVMLSIASDGYKKLGDFVAFANNKSYDAFEKTRYHFCLQSRRPTDPLPMCE